MTDEELNEIRERVQAATEGPWQQDPPDGWDVWSHGGRFYLAQCRTPEDAAFIASSRQDMAALLAEVERLRATLEREQTEHANCEQFHHDGSMAKTHVMVLLAEQNAAMREIVQAVANYDATYCGIELGHECAFDRARATCNDGWGFGCHLAMHGEVDRTKYVLVHTPDCPVTKARAVLAREEEQP